MRLLPPIRKFLAGTSHLAVSVRKRIVAIALDPRHRISGQRHRLHHRRESEVHSAFRSAQQAAEVADASREFKMALTAMRISAKEFAARPSYELVDRLRRRP